MGQLSKALFALYRRARAYFAIEGLRYWLTAAVILVSSIVLTPYAQKYVDLRYQFYHYLSEVNPSSPSPSFTRLVYIEDDVYRGQLDARVPLDRAYLARIVRALDADDVQLIALDFNLTAAKADRPATIGDFAALGRLRPETDDLMLAVAGAAQNRKIVLGKMLWADREEEGQSLVSLPEIYQSYGICTKPRPDGSWANPGAPNIALSNTQRIALSATAAANISCGYINLPQDLRLLPTPLDIGTGGPIDSFSQAIVRAVAPATAKSIPDEKTFAGYFLLKSIQDQEVVTTSQLFGADPAVRDKLRHQIVIVGAHWRTSPAPGADFVDMHTVPGGTISGSVIHQNFIEAMLERRLYYPIESWILEILFATGAAFLFAAISKLWAKVAILAGGVLALLLFQWMVFYLFHLFFDASLSVLGLGLHSIIERFINPRHEHHAPQAGA